MATDSGRKPPGLGNDSMCVFDEAFFLTGTEAILAENVITPLHRRCDVERCDGGGTLARLWGRGLFVVFFPLEVLIGVNCPRAAVEEVFLFWRAGVI